MDMNLMTARQVRAVTPDNDADLPLGVCQALYVGGDAGNIVLIAEGDTASVTIPVTQFQQLNVQAKRVLETTTATGIFAFYS